MRRCTVCVTFTNASTLAPFFANAMYLRVAFAFCVDAAASYELRLIENIEKRRPRSTGFYFCALRFDKRDEIRIIRTFTSVSNHSAGPRIKVARRVPYTFESKIAANSVKRRVFVRSPHSFVQLVVIRLRETRALIISSYSEIIPVNK